MASLLEVAVGAVSARMGMSSARSPLSPRSPSMNNATFGAPSGKPRKSPLRRAARTPLQQQEKLTAAQPAQPDDTKLAHELSKRVIELALAMQPLEVEAVAASTVTAQPISPDAVTAASEDLLPAADAVDTSPCGTALMLKKAHNQVRRHAVAAATPHEIILASEDEDEDEDKYDEYDEHDEYEYEYDEDHEDAYDLEEGIEGFDYNACGVHEPPLDGEEELYEEEDDEPQEEMGVWISRLLARAGVRDPWVAETNEEAAAADAVPHEAQLALAPAAEGSAVVVRLGFVPLPAADCAAVREQDAAERARLLECALHGSWLGPSVAELDEQEAREVASCEALERALEASAEMVAAATAAAAAGATVEAAASRLDGCYEELERAEAMAREAMLGTGSAVGSAGVGAAAAEVEVMAEEVEEAAAHEERARLRWDVARASVVAAAMEAGLTMPAVCMQEDDEEDDYDEYEYEEDEEDEDGSECYSEEAAPPSPIVATYYY